MKTEIVFGPIPSNPESYRRSEVQRDSDRFCPASLHLMTSANRSRNPGQTDTSERSLGLGCIQLTETFAN